MISADLTESVLRGMTQTMRKIGLTAPPRRERPPDHLVVMNIPAMAGRRDAAYLRAIELFRQPLFSLPEAERIVLYDAMISCLDDAIAAGEQISLPQALPEAEPLQDLFCYLRGGIQALALLLHHEQRLFAREKAMNQWCGSDFGTSLRNAEEVVNNIEVGFYHALQEMIELAESPFARFRETTRNALARNEAERYDKAFNEFQTVYRRSKAESRQDAKPED